MAMAIEKDKRYTVSREFCGQTEQKFVLRFCGTFLGHFDKVKQAEVAADLHMAKRDVKLKDWIVVAECKGVVWVRKGKKHRILYGAHVAEGGVKGAAEEFGLCVAHTVAAEGLLED